jgi:hypothetical protein
MYTVQLINVERIKSDLKFKFSIVVKNMFRQDDYGVNRDESYMSDNLGNRYKNIKLDSFSGKKVSFTEGAEEIFWIVFGDIHPDATKATLVLNINGNDKMIFNNIRLPKQ